MLSQNFGLRAHVSYLRLLMITGVKSNGAEPVPGKGTFLSYYYLFSFYRMNFVVVKFKNFFLPYVLDFDISQQMEKTSDLDRQPNDTEKKKAREGETKVAYLLGQREGQHTTRW